MFSFYFILLCLKKMNHPKVSPSKVTLLKPCFKWWLQSSSPSSRGIWSIPSGVLLTLTPIFLYLSPYDTTPHTHTLSPLSHTSGFSIPATKPQQQGGNDPATTAVMMESVGGLAGSLTLPNKSPNNSVNIRADPTTRSNTLTHGRPPHTTLSNLLVGQENCCWPACCVLGAPQCTFNKNLWKRGLAQRTQ